MATGTFEAGKFGSGAGAGYANSMAGRKNSKEAKRRGGGLRYLVRLPLRIAVLTASLCSEAVRYSGRFEGNLWNEAQSAHLPFGGYGCDRVWAVATAASKTFAGWFTAYSYESLTHLMR